MMSIFRRHVEKKEQEVTEKKRELELDRIITLVDQYLKAQDIEDPESREAALSLLRSQFDQPTAVNSTPSPH